MERKGIKIHSPKDISRIQYKGERLVANFLKTLNPNLELDYEKKLYKITPELAQSMKQIKSGTLPDFEIRNPETNCSLIIEVTSCDSRVKETRKRVVEAANPGSPYVVIGGTELKAIRGMMRAGIKRYEKPIPNNIQFVIDVARPVFLASAAD